MTIKRIVSFLPSATNSVKYFLQKYDFMPSSSAWRKLIDALSYQRRFSRDVISYLCSLPECPLIPPEQCARISAILQHMDDQDDYIWANDNTISSSIS